MNERIWGIIGGVALILALLSPLVLGSAKKVERLFGAAEELYERRDYERAIEKYSEALKESNKLAAKTKHIDKDFTTLVNLKIAQCYYHLAERTGNQRHYQTALTHIKKVVLKTEVVKHQEELTYLWADILYKIGYLNQAESKFSRLVEKFPSSLRVPTALYVIADINAKQGNHNEALRNFQRLVDEFPRSDFKTEADRHIVELSKLLPSDDREPPGPPAPNPRIKAILDEANTLRRQGRVHDAYQRYTDLITQYPESEYACDAYIGRAEIHLAAKDYPNARANYEEAVTCTNDAERRAEIYEAYHRTYLIAVYPGPEPIEPNDELFVKARLLRSEGEFVKAAEIYEKLVNETFSIDDTVYALYWAARCYQEASREDTKLFSKSVDLFNMIIEDYGDRPETIKAYYYLALLYRDWAQESGDISKYQSVINTVEKANMKYADSNDTGDRAWLSRMQELKKIAAQELEPAPPKPVPAPEPPSPKPVPAPEPPLKEVYVDEGYRYFEEGKLEEAKEKAYQALEIDPNYQRALTLLSKIKEKYYDLGWTFLDEGRYNQAITEFKKAINIDPKFKKAHFHLGVVYIEQKRYTEAIKAFKKVIDIDPDFKEAYFNLGLAHFEREEYEAAKQAANKALALDPNYEPARVLIEFMTNLRQ